MVYTISCFGKFVNWFLGSSPNIRQKFCPENIKNDYNPKQRRPSFPKIQNQFFGYSSSYDIWNPPLRKTMYQSWDSTTITGRTWASSRKDVLYLSLKDLDRSNAGRELVFFQSSRSVSRMLLPGFFCWFSFLLVVEICYSIISYRQKLRIGFGQRLAVLWLILR